MILKVIKMRKKCVTFYPKTLGQLLKSINYNADISVFTIHQWRRENHKKNPIFMWGQSLLLVSIEKDNWWLLVVMNAEKELFSQRTCFWSSNLFKQSWREHPLLKQQKMISSPNPPLSSGTTEAHMFVSCIAVFSLWVEKFCGLFLPPTHISVSAKME